ncbi:MAG: rRNA maturation RNase YbeY [Planctomycetota bacterium]
MPGEVSVHDRQAALSLDPAAIEQLVRHVLSAEGADDASIEIAIVDDETQSDLHLRFLSIPGPTDVITFPWEEEFTPHGSPVLGEVVVSAETAIRQAGDHPEPPIEGDPLRECLLYVVHGTLHLLGYDDLTPEDAQRMAARQDELFREWWSQT